MVLRDATGVVVDSLNYGALVDPWAAQGYEAASGQRMSGCFAPAPGSGFDLWSIVVDPASANTSTGRYPDGADTSSNCNDFHTQGFTALATAAEQGTVNIKIGSIEGFKTGQTIHIDSGSALETATIATLGTSGATTLREASNAGATVLTVQSGAGFSREQTVTIGIDADAEVVALTAVRNAGIGALTLAKPLAHAHPAGTPISGSGITLAAPLAKQHASGAPVYTNAPTPGAANEFESEK